MKKIIAFMLALTLSFSLLSVTSFAETFADINDVPWAGAKEYINEAVGKGLMSGDTNSKGQRICRPKDNVTYCEAVQFIYNVIKANGKSDYTSSIKEKWLYVMTANNIPSWAYEAVSYALEKDIILSSDLSVFVSSAGKSNNATRENVAYIFGRALKSSGSYDSFAYNDSASIASTCREYVGILSKFQILVGDSSNNFNPKKLINRSEMAVMTIKTYTAVMTGTASLNDGTFTGVVASVSDMSGTYLITLTASGLSQGFIVSDSTYAYDSAGARVLIKDIGIGSSLIVSYNGGTVTGIKVSYLAKNTTTVSGKIDDVTALKISIIDSSGKTSSYYFADDVKITIGGGSYTVSKLITLFKTNEITATEIVLNSGGEVSSITGKAAEVSLLKGRITNLTSSKITIRSTSGSTSKTYYLADEDDLTIKLDGYSRDLDYLRDAYEDRDITATLTLDDDEVVKIVATTGDDDDDDDDYKNGTISSLSYKVLKLKGVSTSFEIEDDGDDITIKVIDGEDTITDFDELYDAFDDGKTLKVQVCYDDDDVVTKITGYVSQVEGSLNYLSSSRIKVQVGSGKYSYEIEDEDDITIYLDDDSVDFDELYEEYEDYDLDVVVTLDSKGYVTRIEAE